MATSEIDFDLPALGSHERAETGQMLQSTLVELITLSLTGKQLHWNIHGPGFREFHLHLDELIDAWRELADVVAERAVSIGSPADGRSETVTEQSGLEPVAAGPKDVPEAIGELTALVATVDKRARDRCVRLGDIDLISQDVLIEVARTLEKQLWMIRSSWYPREAAGSERNGA